jgi:hypothetical protein
MADADPIWTQLSALDLVDHEARAFSRLAQQYRDKPNISAVLRILCAKCQELEVVFQQLLTLRLIETATGAQLDVLERILRQPTLFLDDTTRRLYLRARILLNLSSGTPDQVLRIFTTVLTAPMTAGLQEYPPASFVLRLTGAALDPVLVDVMASFLRSAKDAGVYATLEWSESAPADTFRLDAGPGLDVGHLAGATL